MRGRIVVGASALAVILTSCAGPHERQRAADRPGRLFDGMGTHHRRVTTSSAEAQRYFDQGLIWAYAFNHDEAIRSFREATRLDPECAMAYWGIALCNGPHINNPIVTPERARDAWSAVQAAMARRGATSPVERKLIEAVAARYSADPRAERRPLDEAYAAAMGGVWASHQDDADVGALYAEALMDLQPWDLWAADGSPKGRTTEIVSVLEAALKLDAGHPGANHLYIHAVEASPHPELAAAAADRLREAVPASGHLVHMPSHIDVQLGRWALAADQNVRAIQADQAYRALVPPTSFQQVYKAHNRHFLAFASMMEGRREAALGAARAMVQAVPREFLREHPELIDPYMMIASEVLMRFGRWEEVLLEPPPPSNLPISRAMWHFARASALAAKGAVSEAVSEQESFRAAVRRVPGGAIMAINPAHRVLSIAEHMLAGEIAYRRGEMDAAVALLREAVEIEDGLLYMEPPEWVQPVRHALGAILLEGGRIEEAESVYRRDLELWPENGWSLYGLAACLRARGAIAEAEAVQRRFERTWSRADTEIGASCLCVAGGAGDARRDKPGGSER